MLMIRLQRVGKRNKSAFRLVVTDRRNGPQSGRFLEVLGHYDPHQNIVKFDKERVQHWLSVGARPSPSAHNLLISEKIIEGKKVNVLPRKSPIKSTEEAEGAEAPSADSGESEKTDESEDGDVAENTPAEDEVTSEESTEAGSDDTTQQAPAEEEKTAA